MESWWARAADPSLVRYFVFGVLAAVAPPYSSYFASSLLRCALLPLSADFKPSWIQSLVALSLCIATCLPRCAVLL